MPNGQQWNQQMQIDASVNYHVKKAADQAFEFDVDGIVGNLVSPELVPTDIRVTDLRHAQMQLEFHSDGIQFIAHHSGVQDFENDQDWQPTYDQELIELLKTHIGASEVIVFDFVTAQAFRIPMRKYRVAVPVR